MAAVRSGELAEAKIDAALERVLLLRYQLAEPALRPMPQGQRIAATAAWRACRILRNNQGLLPLTQSFYLAAVADPTEYSQIQNSRGIGPNDPIPASAVVVEQLHQLRTPAEVLSWPVLANWLQRGDALQWPLVLLTEDYPLPGSRLDLKQQQGRVQQCIDAWGAQVIVLALRSDTELVLYPGLQTYLCSYSSRRCSAQAAVGTLLGLPDGGWLPTAQTM